MLDIHLEITILQACCSLNKYLPHISLGGGQFWDNLYDCTPYRSYACVLSMQPKSYQELFFIRENSKD